MVVGASTFSGSKMLVQNAALFVSKCRVHKDYSELQLLPLFSRVASLTI